MIPDQILRSLVVQTESKLLRVVIDGLGGLPVRGPSYLALFGHDPFRPVNKTGYAVP